MTRFSYNVEVTMLARRNPGPARTRRRRRLTAVAIAAAVVLVCAACSSSSSTAAGGSRPANGNRATAGPAPSGGLSTPLKVPPGGALVMTPEGPRVLSAAQVKDLQKLQLAAAKFVAAKCSDLRRGNTASQSDGPSQLAGQILGATSLENGRCVLLMQAVLARNVGVTAGYADGLTASNGGILKPGPGARMIVLSIRALPKPGWKLGLRHVEQGVFEMVYAGFANGACQFAVFLPGAAKTAFNLGVWHPGGDPDISAIGLAVARG